MIEWSLDALAASESVRAIVVAAPPAVVAGSSGRAANPWRVDPRHGPTTVVEGGATRAESVSKALGTVETELVAIHDAARPLLTPELVEALVATLEASPEAAGVIAATPVTDTVKRVAADVSAPSQTRGSLRRSDGQKEPREVKGAGRVEETVDRSHLWAAQTPQLFRTAALREALASSPRPELATDEAMLVEQAGGTVLIHPCGPQNLKVTTPLDLRLAELLLHEQRAR